MLGLFSFTNRNPNLDKRAAHSDFDFGEPPEFGLRELPYMWTLPPTTTATYRPFSRNCITFLPFRAIAAHLDFVPDSAQVGEGFSCQNQNRPASDLGA
jgi:hypothetical protein